MTVAMSCHDHCMNAPMTIRSMLARVASQEDLNFLLTNRIPRQLATRFMGWFSQIEQPLVRDLSIGVWRLFADLDLDEASKARRSPACTTASSASSSPARARSTRIPRCWSAPATRSSAPAAQIDGDRADPGQGLPVHAARSAGRPRAGPASTATAATSRCGSPRACTTASTRRTTAASSRSTYISGDTWNINPIALKRVERLFCKNERAVRAHAPRGRRPPDHAGAGGRDPGRQHPPALPGRAPAPQHRGPNVIACDARFRKGEEMGWFEHGSTIIVFAPKGFALCDGVATGRRIRMGQPLLRLP